MPQSYTLLPTCLGTTNNLTAYAELIINSFGKEKAQKKTDFSLKRYSWVICINDEAYTSKEIQDNRAATHTTNHESLATICIHDISLVLDKEDVSK